MWKGRATYATDMSSASRYGEDYGAVGEDCGDAFGHPFPLGYPSGLYPVTDNMVLVGSLVTGGSCACQLLGIRVVLLEHLHARRSDIGCICAPLT